MSFNHAQFSQRICSRELQWRKRQNVTQVWLHYKARVHSQVLVWPEIGQQQNKIEMPHRANVEIKICSPGLTADMVLHSMQFCGKKIYMRENFATGISCTHKLTHELTNELTHEKHAPLLCKNLWQDQSQNYKHPT